MIRGDNAYSRFVGWVKILLPVAALGLVSSLFLLSRPDLSDGELLFSDLDLSEIAREQSVSNPNYTGVMDDGRRINISATRAVPLPEDPELIDTTDLRASLETQENGLVRLSADAARLDSAAQSADLVGQVAVWTETGLRLTGDALRVVFPTSDVSSQRPVVLTGPGIVLEAGAMNTLAQEGMRGDVETGHAAPVSQVSFTGGVRLIYTPAETRAAEQ